MSDRIDMFLFLPTCRRTSNDVRQRVKTTKEDCNEFEKEVPLVKKVGRGMISTLLVWVA